MFGLEVRRRLAKFIAGYPGGWKKYARGDDLMRWGRTPPFEQPNDPDDRRSLIPAEGLLEYWYPAMPNKEVGKKKPVALKILGKELVFFRDRSGEVQALWDYCPHRGAYLSWGDCFWNGFVSCPYHGATFDGEGRCVAVITEGPDSKMVGRMSARKYPTITLKGTVFVWMGEGQPADPEVDIPPDWFEQDTTVVLTAWRYWHCNWMIALENTGDAHNMWYVHRNSFRQLRSTSGGRQRSPVGSRMRMVDSHTVDRITGTADQVGKGRTDYYADESGKTPHQLYYPGVDGYWPKHRYRLLWGWFYDGMVKLRRNSRSKRPFENPPNWEGMILPGMVRNNHSTHMYTRWPIAVDKDLTRVYYALSSRPSNIWGRTYDRVTYFLYLKWMLFFNFSDQDYDAMRSSRYQYPEYLSSTDNPVVMLRRLITEHGRGLQKQMRVRRHTSAEEMVYEGDRLLGEQPDDDLISEQQTQEERS
jgi:phenylpropionate dioxygenase-like ring-hydroxylating dioxygenase large terminal subunit